MTASRSSLPDSYEGLLSRAQASLRNNDIESAISLYRRVTTKLARLSDRVLQRRPDLRDLHRQARLELTSLLHMEGRFAEAIEVKEVLLDTHPDEAETWRRDLAALRISKGEVERGFEELQTLAAEKPRDSRGWIILGREARIEGRLAESQSALGKALDVCPQDETETLAEIHYQHFRLFKEMGQLDKAMAAWEQAVTFDDVVRESIREVYTMLTDAGRYSEAQSYVARDDNALQAGFQRGLIASLTGKPDDAWQEWEQVADLDPDTFEYGHDAWVESVLRLEDPIPALEWLQENLPLYPEPRLLVLSGIGWAMEEDQELAAVLFQRAINLTRWERHPKQKLDSADWRLLDALVNDDEMKTTLKPYFAVIETLWG